MKFFEINEINENSTIKKFCYVPAMRWLIKTGQAKQAVHYNNWRGGRIDTIVGRDNLNVNCLILHVFYNKLFSKHISTNNTPKQNSNASLMVQYQFYFKIRNSLTFLFLEYINEIQKY